MASGSRSRVSIEDYTLTQQGLPQAGTRREARARRHSDAVTPLGFYRGAKQGAINGKARMTHALYINQRGMLKRKPPGYWEVIRELEEFVGEPLANYTRPRTDAVTREDTGQRLTHELESPWWIL